MLTKKMMKQANLLLALVHKFIQKKGTMNFYPEIQETERGTRLSFSFIATPETKAEIQKEYVLENLELMFDAPKRKRQEVPKK